MADLTDAMQHGKKKPKKGNPNDGDKQRVKPPNPGFVYFEAYFRVIIGMVKAEMQAGVNARGERIKITTTQASASVYNQGALTRSKRIAGGIMTMAEAFRLDKNNNAFIANPGLQEPFDGESHMSKLLQQLLSYIETNHPVIYESFGADETARALRFLDLDHEARIAMNDAYDDWVRVFGDKDDDSLGGGDDDDFMHEPPMAKNELRMAENELPMARVVGMVVDGKVISIDNGAAAPVPPSSPPPPGVGNVSAPVEKVNETESEEETEIKQDKQPKQEIKVKTEKIEEVKTEKIKEVKIKPDPDGPASGPAGGAAEGAARSGTMRPGITGEVRQRRAEKRKATIEEAEEEEPEVIEID